MVYTAGSNPNCGPPMCSLHALPVHVWVFSTVQKQKNCFVGMNAFVCAPVCSSDVQRLCPGGSDLYPSVAGIGSSIPGNMGLENGGITDF